MIKVIKKRSIYARNVYGDGCHGEYRIFNRAKTRGIKIFYANCETKAEMYRDWSWDMAKKEFAGLKRASKAGLSPKVYKLVIVENKGEYSPAVIMQHIKEHDREYDYSDSHALEKKLQKIGINHNDMHSGNVVFCSKLRKLLAIDFAMATIKKRRRKKK